MRSTREPGLYKKKPIIKYNFDKEDHDISNLSLYLGLQELHKEHNLNQTKRLVDINNQ